MRVAANGAENLVAVAAALVEYQLSGKAPLLRTSALTSVPQEIRADLMKEFDRASAELTVRLGLGLGFLQRLDDLFRIRGVVHRFLHSCP